MDNIFKKNKEKSAESIENTSNIDVRAISDAIEKNNKKKRAGGGIWAFASAHRVLFVCICAVVVLAIASGGVLGFMVLSNPLHGYAQVAVAKEDIMRVMEVSSTLEAGDSYEITSLVSGKVIECGFEVGDEVAAGDVLYKLDDTEAKLAVERAKNELDKANDSGTTAANYTARITSSDAGVVQTMSIKTGSIVSPGTQIGSIKRDDGTVIPIFAYMSGQVTVVSVRVGQALSAGQLIATVNTKTASERNTPYDKKSSEIDLQAVQRQLENYTIKSPVTGVVLEKYSKVGDNVGIADTDKPMMVILDTSKLNFTFSVDEYQLKDIKKGQIVFVKTESIPDESFVGEVAAIATVGRADESGKPLFDVLVTISETGELKAGMNITAEVVLDSVKKVLAVPEKALLETDGQNALVIVRCEETEEVEEIEEIEEPSEQDEQETEEEAQKPRIKVPKGCTLKTVTYGVSNGDKVQILWGLELGDIVVYSDKSQNNFIRTTIEVGYETPSIENNETAEELSYSEGIEEEPNDELETEMRREIDKLLNEQENNML